VSSCRQTNRPTVPDYSGGGISSSLPSQSDAPGRRHIRTPTTPAPVRGTGTPLAVSSHCRPNPVTDFSIPGRISQL